MPKKRNQEEEILLFAMKIIMPVAAVFIVAVVIDAASLVSLVSGFVRNDLWNYIPSWIA